MASDSSFSFFSDAILTSVFAFGCSAVSTTVDVDGGNTDVEEEEEDEEDDETSDELASDTEDEDEDEGSSEDFSALGAAPEAWEVEAKRFSNWDSAGSLSPKLTKMSGQAKFGLMLKFRLLKNHEHLRWKYIGFFASVSNFLFFEGWVRFLYYRSKECDWL